MKVLLVKPQEVPQQVELGNDLASMQKVVGGLIQAVYPFEDPVAVICNEEGKISGLPMNRVLRDQESGQIYDVICGTFFVCGLGMEDFQSLSDSLLEKYRRLFYCPEYFVKCR